MDLGVERSVGSFAERLTPDMGGWRWGKDGGRLRCLDEFGGGECPFK